MRKCIQGIEFSKAEGKCANKGVARDEAGELGKDTTYLI